MQREHYRILAIHNYFKHPGGEDMVFDTETALLEDSGHEVIRYTLHNDQIDERATLNLAATSLWNTQAHAALRRLIHAHRPHVAHFHNPFPLISPAAYHSIKTAGLPIVQTLHDYRFFCMNGLFFRQNSVCEQCLGHAVQWPGVRHRCYRGSRAASGVVMLINLAHRLSGTWSKTVDAFIALTEFSRQKYIQAGLTAEKIAVKSNCVYPAPQMGHGGGGNVLFVGRLSPEKGIEALLAAWQQLRSTGYIAALRIAGEGPLEQMVRDAAANTPGIQYLGWQNSAAIYAEMQEAEFLVVPSIWYEGLPRVIVEAFACGLPVVTGNFGNTALLVQDGITGRLFRFGDPADLAIKMRQMLDAPRTSMRLACRQKFSEQFSPELTVRRLEEIYAGVIGLRATSA